MGTFIRILSEKKVDNKQVKVWFLSNKPNRSVGAYLNSRVDFRCLATTIFRETGISSYFGTWVAKSNSSYWPDCIRNNHTGRESNSIGRYWTLWFLSWCKRHSRPRRQMPSWCDVAGCTGGTRPACGITLPNANNNQGMTTGSSC